MIQCATIMSPQATAASLSLNKNVVVEDLSSRRPGETSILEGDFVQVGYSPNEEGKPFSATGDFLTEITDDLLQHDVGEDDVYFGAGPDDLDGL